MKVNYHILRDYKLNVVASSDEQVLSLLTGKERAKAKRDMYSFVSMRYHPGRKTIFLGCTHRNGDILVEFNPATNKFKSCGFARSGLYNPNVTKIHKGITLNEKEDALYFGTASLSPLSETMGSKGGLLVRYDIKKRKFTRIANPTPGDFHQATCFDFKRGKAYIYTGRGAFAVYDLKKRKTIRYEVMESCPHNGCVDDDGGAWGTHSPGRQAFFRYNPDRNKFEFPEGCAFPNAAEAANIMYHGAGPVDSIVNGGDGYLYAASALGEVYRIDPRSGEVKFLGKPFPGIRLPGMYVADDGWIYMCGAKDRASMLARYCRQEKRFEFLGSVEHKDGTYLNYAHEIVVIDGVAYIGETDNKRRGGYLWTCEF